MNFLQEHAASLFGHLAYHARTLLNRQHRARTLGICSGDGKATVVLVEKGRVTAIADDLTEILDPPIRLDTIRGDWSERIKAVAADDRAPSVDGFRRKFLEASGVRSRVRAAFVMDRPKGTAASEVWSGKRGDETRLAPATILDLIRRNPKEKIESWQGNDKEPWRWHLLLPSLAVPGDNEVSANYLVFGAMEADVLEAERWAEETGRVEIDLLVTAQYAALRFLSEGFFEPEKPCLVARVYSQAAAAPGAGAAPGIDYRAVLCAWDGEKVFHVASHIEVRTLANRATRVAASLVKDLTARVEERKDGSPPPSVPLPFYFLAPPEVAGPAAETMAGSPPLFETVVLQRGVLTDPKGLFRKRCPDVALALEDDLPGTPELVLALWAALRVPGFAAHKADDPSEQYLSDLYRARQLRRTEPIMRRGAGLTLALAALLVLLLPVIAFLYWDGGNANDDRDAASAAVKAKGTELVAFGETTLRMEDLATWSIQAERWPLSAVLARATRHFPDALALREVQARALPEGSANPTGYELILSGFAKPDSGPVEKLLAGTFPGASVREIPAANLVAGAVQADNTILAPLTADLVPWRVNVTVDFARLKASDYGLTATSSNPTSSP